MTMVLLALLSALAWPQAPALDRLFDDWRKVDDYNNIFVANKHLLDPLTDFCNSHLSDSRVAQFMTILTKLRKAHNELRDMKVFFGRSFQTEAQDLDEIRKSFTEAIRFFSPTIEDA